ncbi:hypothetical protein Gorai_005829, partial [Gossypium raimondii]|nr:hypothetical protein [Gossypium raimondii]
MEESIAGLPIADEEEETILLGVESSDQENFYANCFVGIFLTSSVVNFQAMRTMLENDWHPNGGVSILDLGDGVSTTVDSNEALRNLTQVPNLSRSTKLQGFRMVVIKRKCGFQNGIDVDSDGRSGGLSMGWNNNGKVSIRSFSRRHINIMIDKYLEEKAWRCTGFYGAPEENIRE